MNSPAASSGAFNPKRLRQGLRFMGVRSSVMAGRAPARRMLNDGVPLEKIARMTGLDRDAIKGAVAERAAMKQHFSNPAPHNSQPVKFFRFLGEEDRGDLLH